MSTPDDWQRVELSAGVGFAIPPDARPGAATSVDSTAGCFDGDSYRITFDLGRFGERLDRLRDEKEFRSESRVVAGRPSIEVAFAPSDEPFAWARVLQVEVDSTRTLTLRMSCDAVERCAMADIMFDSIEIPPR